MHVDYHFLCHITIIFFKAKLKSYFVFEDFLDGSGLFEVYNIYIVMQFCTAVIKTLYSFLKVVKLYVRF